MHKFAVIHKPSGIVCYSTNREIRFEPGFNYEIVNNSNEYKTVTPNLTFNSYAEIADAIKLSDKLTFTKGDDDILTISDNARSVTIPVLLFDELRLDVEEVAMGDVEELMEDYAFNPACTELLARNAIKFWVATRLLDTTTAIKTVAECLDTYESLEFPNETAFKYKGDEYLLSDFIYTTATGWHGVMGLSYFSAYYVRFEYDGSLTLGYAYW